MKKLAIIILLGLFLSLAGVLCFIPLSFPPLNKLIIYALEKRLDADIDCGRLSVKLFNSLHAEDIKARGKRGVSLFIKEGDFSYNPVSIIATGRLEVKVNLRHVAIRGEASILDLLTDLLRMEPLREMVFSNIKGSFFIGVSDTIIQGLAGTSEDMRFSTDGLTGKDNSINLRLSLLLNDNLTSAVPNEMRNAIFKKEEGAWMSVLLGITGNYKKPSLRVISEGFRLDLMIK